MSPTQVILYEPNARLRCTFELELMRAGYQVTLGLDEAKTLDLGRELKPDLALVSASPSDSGTMLSSYDLTSAMIRGQMVKAAVMSAHKPSRETIIRAARAGALEFLATPAPKEVLYRKLASAYDRATRGGDSISHQQGGPDDTTSLDAKLENIIQKADTLRAMPDSATRVLQIDERSTHGADELTRAVESDPSIAAVILRRARSARYSGTAPVTELKQAVVRLGLRETRQIVLGLALVKAVPPRERCFGLNRTLFWVHCLACGILTKLICKQCKMNDTDQGFLAGLLHDIGKAMLDDFISDEYQMVIQSSNLDRKTIHEVELGILKRDHAMIGSLIAFQWGFPEFITDAIGQHHESIKIWEGGEPPEVNQTGAVSLANLISKALLVGSGGDFIVPDVPLRVWEAYGFEDGVDGAFLSSFHKDLREFSSFFGLSAGDLGLGYELDRRAVIVNHEDHHSIFTKLVMQGLGADTLEIDNLDILIGRNDDEPLCLLHTENLDAAMSAAKTTLANGLDIPMVCIIRAGDFAGSLSLDTARPWVRAVSTPLDCFELATNVLQVDAEFKNMQGTHAHSVAVDATPSSDQ